MISQELYNQTKTLITAANHVLIMPSSPPDGDSIGSALALYLVLKKLGKNATVVCTESIPNLYNFLPNIAVIQKEFVFARDLIVTIDYTGATEENVRHEIEPNKINIIITPKKGKLSAEQVKVNYGDTTYDLVITVDAGDVSQFGKAYEDNTELFHLVPVVNIDHHISNNQFGKLNLIDVMASSASSIVMSVIETLDAGLIDADIATLLLAGLITDTGSFQNPNTTPDSFAIAAKLIEYGARQQEIIQHIYKTKKMSTLKLWGRVLSKIQYDEAHRFVWSTITADDLADTNALPEEADGIIDELMTAAPGCEVAILIKDKGNGVISGSIRTTTPSIDASKLAEHFGGGGHLQAAGFKIHGKTLAEVEPLVVEYIKTTPQKFEAIETTTIKKEPSKLETLMKEASGSERAGQTRESASGGRPSEAELEMKEEAVLVKTTAFPTPLDMRGGPATAGPQIDETSTAQKPTTEPPKYNPVATPDELV